MLFPELGCMSIDTRVDRPLLHHLDCCFWTLSLFRRLANGREQRFGKMVSLHMGELAAIPETLRGHAQHRIRRSEKLCLLMRFGVQRGGGGSGIGLFDTGRYHSITIATIIIIKEVRISDPEIGPSRLQPLHGFVSREVCGAAGAEEGQKAIEGSDCNPQQASGADRLELDLLRQRVGSAVPDCVEDDVGDRVERTVAVAGLEQAVVVLTVSWWLARHTHQRWKSCGTKQRWRSGGNGHKHGKNTQCTQFRGPRVEVTPLLLHV